MSSPESPVCDIIIPIWNELALTRGCLESIDLSTPEKARLILIDNGSEPPTREYLKQLCGKSRLPIHLIRNDTNLGFIRAVNEGLRAATAPWVCLLNNDTVVTPGWLTEMLKVARSDSTIGLVNPTSNSLGFHAGAVPLEEYAKSLLPHSGQATELSTALGFCLLSRRDLFDRVGLLDESFGMGYFEDDDLSRRVRKEGSRCVRACAAYVFHEEKGSFRHLADTDQSFRENKERFEERWGRRLRILWVAGNHGPSSSIFQEAALELLQGGHWVCCAGPLTEFPPTLSTYAQLSRLPYGNPNSSWRLRAVWKLLARRKKPFHLVISADPRVSRWVKRLRLLHGVPLLESPTTMEIREQCQNLCRSR